MPPDRRASTSSSSHNLDTVYAAVGDSHAYNPPNFNASGSGSVTGGQDADDHSASPSAEPEGNGNKGKRKLTRGIGRGRSSDGVQPQCGVCISTAIRLGQDPSLVICDFPSEEERRKPVGGGKVYALEAKIQALEQKLAEAETRAAAGGGAGGLAMMMPDGGAAHGHVQQQQQQQQQLGLHPPMMAAGFPQMDIDQSRPSSQPRPHTASATGMAGSSSGRTPRPRHASAGGQAFYDPTVAADTFSARFPLESDNGAALGSPFAGFGFPGSANHPFGGAGGHATPTPLDGSAGVFPPYAHHHHHHQQPPQHSSSHPPLSTSAAPPPSVFSQGGGNNIMSSQFVASPTYISMGSTIPATNPSPGSAARPAPFSDPPPLLPASAHMSSATAPAAALLPSGPRLPSYSTLSRLVNIFFDYPHEAIDLINRKRFMSAFEHPPDHPDYPAECLLHAMVATATDLAGLDAWEGEERYWNDGQSPAVFHADLAEYLLPLGFRTERNLLQVAQAAVLFACLNLYHGRFSRAYIDTSIAVRICTSLGLNHNIFVPNHLPLSSFLAHRTALPPPQDEEEARERSVTWWFAYTVETFSAAATGWACCIDERDITTLVPAAGPVGDDPMAREALYLHSPSFFVTNPPHLVRLVQINLKVTVLLNRVCTFVSRTTALANATPERSALQPSEFPKIRSSPAFTKLESALENFGRKAPAQLVALLEPEAFLCPSLVATSVIILHERFCTSDHNDPSMLKCLEAANSILQNMQVLNNASFHPRQIPPFLSYCWTVAARTYLRQMAIRQYKGMPPTYGPSGDGQQQQHAPGSNTTLEDEVRHLTQIVTSIIARLEHFRTPVGPLMAASLVSLLDRPDICLPESDRVQVDQTGQTAIANLTSVMTSVAPAAVNV
ncbi:hypothetical protein JCM10908_000454 [Rhodotorula pacifica]|uniref:fungal specific transcription factor domain-containing protein n=1 Tax=Rhodotorula pacifica TaxID=1495444 RepID=UPI00317ACEFA